MIDSTTKKIRSIRAKRVALYCLRRGRVITAIKLLISSILTKNG
jgi:hypothetical protein